MKVNVLAIMPMVYCAACFRISLSSGAHQSCVPQLFANPANHSCFILINIKIDVLYSRTVLSYFICSVIVNDDVLPLHIMNLGLASSYI